MSWLRRLIFRKKMESDLEKELRFHFESQVADKMRTGIAEAEARRLTRLEFGGMEQIKLAFYPESLTDEKEPWSFWRLEGPGFVWNYRVLPHVRFAH